VLIANVLLTSLFRSGWAMGATIVGALIGVIAGQLLLAPPTSASAAGAGRSLTQAPARRGRRVRGGSTPLPTRAGWR
jgi:hypothetical protein